MDDVKDLGEATSTEPSAPSSQPTLPTPEPAPTHKSSTAPTEDEPDVGPAHAEPGWHKGPAKPKGKPPRITATIRTDINAKISIPLEILGRIWWAKDGYCGTAFMEQRPAIAESLTDIVCQSADLVNFFTGTGGGFMLYLNLGAAVWPVVEMVWAHHVFHSIDEQASPHAPEPQYAA